jgi:predicted small integral membrane protein
MPHLNSGNWTVSWMNKALYAVLFFSILVIIFASVYLINRKAPPPLSNQTGFTQIYTPKPGGRIFTAMHTSGENCTSNGIRFNIANEHTLVDRESTWIFTLNNNPIYCTDKPWWAPKIGSHGDDDQASGLYEASVPYNGGFHLMRTEGPFPQYHPCVGYQ